MSRPRLWLCSSLVAAVTLATLASGSRPAPILARAIDASTRAPIADAVVTIGGKAIRSDARGSFAIDPAAGGSIRARAQGYSRMDVDVKSLGGPNPEIRLKAFRPKALYLSVYGIGSRELRNAALELIDKTELNALVIDVKGDRGLVPYRSGVALAREIGAQRIITVDDLPGLVATLHKAGIYTIARIVLFKDDLLAAGRPKLAIRRSDGSVFRDREGLAWANPYSRDVWAYNIALAVEAARAGFDEIQFDYARLPDARGLAFDLAWTEANREVAVEGFLREAVKALVPYNVFVAADVFGYICWNTNDTKIGQKIEHLAAIVDYVSPMLYPSGFQYGIPAYRNPVEHPYEIVRLSLERARKRTQLPPAHFRPWLQAFRDYAFGGRAFTAGEVRLQIKAAEDFGAAGWMLWNPRNRYSAADLKPRPALLPPAVPRR